MNLLNKINKKLKKGELITYNFETKCTGIAGLCPDCDGVVSYVSYFKRYICLNPDCCFEADIEKVRVWDNSMRDKFLGKEKENELS